jgi:urease accessory protein
MIAAEVELAPVNVAKSLAELQARNRAVGTVALAACSINGLTRPGRLHEEGSLRVRFPGNPGPVLDAVLVNTAGGIAGGDRFSVELTVGENAAVVVTSAAAEKIYRSNGPDSSVRVALHVTAGANLAWLPQETILFDRARLRRHIDVTLADDAHLLLAEGMVFGRTGMGETVRQGLLFDRWRIRRGGRLLHAETTWLEGAIADSLDMPAIAAGGIAVANVLVVPGDDSAVERVRALEGLRGEVGASAWNGMAVVRICAHDGAALRHDLAAVVTALRGTALPRAWLT